MTADAPSREQLLQQAIKLGIEHPENMTRVELVRAIAQHDVAPAAKAASSRAGSWLDIARQLLAAVVEQGLNMPDAAALIRGETKLAEPPKPQPPLATVTLAKIYAAQGHVTRALAVLSEVLTAEPDHQAALDLQNQIKNKSSSEAPRRKPQPVVGMGAVAPKPASRSASEPSSGEPPAQQVSRIEPKVAIATPAVQPAPKPQPEPAPIADTVQSEPGIVETLAEPMGGEQDLLVLVVSDGAAPSLSWQLAVETEAARRAGIGVEIEWTTFEPSWQGPIRQLVRVPVTRAVGRMTVPKAAAPGLVHAVLGLRQGPKVVPLATLMVAQLAAEQGQAPRITRGRASSRTAAAALVSRVSASPAR